MAISSEKFQSLGICPWPILPLLRTWVGDSTDYIVAGANTFYLPTDKAGADYCLCPNNPAVLASVSIQINEAVGITRIGQRVVICAQNTITALTVTVAGKTLRGPAITTLAAGGTIILQKIQNGIWYRIQ